MSHLDCHTTEQTSVRHGSLDKQKPSIDPTLEAVNAVSQLLRRASTSDNARRLLIKGKNRDNMHSSSRAVISSEEYGKLPPSIQRKYFSSEERLQIAQQSAAEKRQRQQTKKADSSTPLKPQMSCEFTKRRKTIRKSDSKKQRRSSLPLLLDNNAPTADVAWYDALPDKVKRSQFDNEERSNIFRGIMTERPHTSSGKPSFDTISWDKNRSASVETPRIPHSTCTTPSLHSPSPSIAASSRSHDSRLSNQRSAMSLRNAPSTQPSTPGFPSTKIRTPELERLASRRQFLLHPIPLPPPTLAPVPALMSPDTTKYMHQEQAFVLRVDHDDYSMDETTPTQELELTQMKLKNMPPAWYDEKLDFGFQGSSRKPSTSTYDSWEHPRTMSPSISDTASSHGPMTPISPAIHGLQPFDNTKSTQPSLQQIIESNLNITNFSHLQQPSNEYDMVKPRKSKPKHLVDGFYEGQDQPYSITIHYDNHDPLALETLPVCDDMSGAHGAFAVHPEHSTSGFRKVLKVIRGH